MANKKLGFFLAGGSGSGKTTSSLFIAEAIANLKPTQEDLVRFKEPRKLEAIAIDVHANDPSNARSWDTLGIAVVWKPEAILKQLNYLEDEFEARKAGRKANRILIFFDEYGETYKALKRLFINRGDSVTAINRELSRIAGFIVALATGGARKFGMVPIIMNQTWNCNKLKMDASERNNFVGIYLNKLAFTYAHNAKVKDKDTLALMEENQDNYLALVSGGYPDSFMPHPAFPGKPLSQIGVPPERMPEVNLEFPTMMVVDHGVRYPDGYRDSTDGGRMADGKADGSKSLSDREFSNSSGFSLEKILNSQTDEDTVRLEKIHDFWASGEQRLSIIIPSVWSDFPGAGKVDSRAYKKCREEYRRLTGK